MKVTLLIIGLILFVKHTSFCQATETLTNKAVIDLVKAGLDNSIVVSKINSSTCNFDLSTNGLIALKKSGVPAEVIKAMVDKSTAAIPLQPGQDKTKTPSISGLDNVNFVYALQSDGSAKPLEKTLANQKEKSNNVFASAMGVGGSKIVLQIDGAKSSIRFDAAQQLNFLVKTGTDASPQFALYKVKSSKNKREATLAKATVVGGMKGSEGATMLDISKQDNGIYRLSPNTKLDKGEYFFVPRERGNAGNDSEVYAFGID